MLFYDTLKTDRSRLSRQRFVNAHRCIILHTVIQIALNEHFTIDRVFRCFTFDSSKLLLVSLFEILGITAKELIHLPVGKDGRGIFITF